MGKAVELLEGLGIELGLKLKRRTGRDSFAVLKERHVESPAWRTRRLEEGDDDV